MQQRTPRPIRPEHLPRLLAWALLWLVKYAWFLVYGGDEAKRQLARHARLIANLIVVRASHRFAIGTKRHTHRPPAAPPGFVKRRCVNTNLMRRAIIGAELRRRLRARGNGLRLTALINALFDLDAHANRVAKRMARRLTRLCPLVPARPPADAVFALAAPAPLCADTS
jgi:hypothetical protein